MPHGGHGSHELVRCAQNLTDCFYHMIAMDAEEQMLPIRPISKPLYFCPYPVKLDTAKRLNLVIQGYTIPVTSWDPNGSKLRRLSLIAFSRTHL